MPEKTYLEHAQMLAEAQINAVKAASEAAQKAAQLRATSDAAAQALEAAKLAANNLPKDALDADKLEKQNAMNTAQGAYMLALQSAESAEADAELLQSLLRNSPAQPQQDGKGAYKESNTAMIFSAILVAVILGAVVWKDSSLLNAVSSVDTARGLVTFLVTASASGIAFMLIYHAFSSNTQADRFRMAREIFTALIGILGTIIGYYFGVPKETERDRLSPEMPAGPVEPAPPNQSAPAPQNKPAPPTPPPPTPTPPTQETKKG